VATPEPLLPVARRANPWWIPPFLGRVPRAIDAHALRVLGFVSIGLAFDSYDNSLINSTISRVADQLGMPMDRVGFYTAAIRVAGLVAFLAVPFADRLGRRRVFLASLIGMSAGYLATALAQTPVQWVLAQIATRSAMLVAYSVGAVIVSEEMPAAHRGWALGTIVAVSGFGYALGMVLFAFVNELPGGWRALYALGMLPLAVLPWLRRELAETRRFREHRRSSNPGSVAGGWRAWLAPVAALARRHPRRAAAVGSAGLFAAMGGIGIFQFMVFLIERVHGWAPWQFSVMVIGGGIFGIVGNAIAGRLADKIGRRVVGGVAYLMLPLAAAAFYNGPGWSLPLAWIGIVAFGTAGDVIVRVLATELFPTSHRSTAVGWLTLLQSTGWGVGLLLIGLADVQVEDIGRVVPAASCLCILASLALLAVPETRSLELEAISGER
jgi:MFS family permease